MTAEGLPIGALVNWISDELRTPVVDRTNLSGHFDIVFEYASPTVAQAANLVKTDAAPALRDALRDQLGLRLERGTGPVSITVVESAQRPTAD